jgi:hypothetical protein
VTSERLRHRLELRRSNAAVPHRNRYRERYDGDDWLEEWEEELDSLRTRCRDYPE